MFVFLRYIVLYTVHICDIDSYSSNSLLGALPTASGILQPIARPSWLQGTPVLIEVEPCLILVIREQRSIAELSTGVRLRPEAQADGVLAVVVDYTGWEREASLRSYLRDELAI